MMDKDAIIAYMKDYKSGPVTFAAVITLTKNVDEMKSRLGVDSALELLLTHSLAVAASKHCNVFIAQDDKLEFKEEEDIKMSEAVYASYRTNFVTFLLDLAACYQVRELKNEHIMNYFKGKGIYLTSATGIKKVISAFAGNFTNICSDDEFRALLSDMNFVKYHTTYSSTASLCKKMLDSLGQLSNKLFTPQEIKAVEDSLNAYWSKEMNSKISKRMIAITAVFLKVNGMLPNVWYQGTRALSEVPVSVTGPVAVLFVNHRRITMKEKAAAEIQDLATL